MSQIGATPDATGWYYYTLKILKVTGINSSARELYVELRVSDTMQRTRAIHSVDDAWNETLPIRIPMSRTPLSLSLLRRSKFLPFPRTVGISTEAFADIVEQCDGQEEMILELHDPVHATTPRLVISLLLSDAKENATVALYNLLSLVDGSIGLASESHRLDNVNRRVEQLLEDGKALMRSSLAQSAKSTVRRVNYLVDNVDTVVQADALLNVGWQVVAASYTVALAQIKLDKRIGGLLQSLVFVFEDLKNASQLADNVDLTYLHQIIVNLLDLVVKCSLFVRNRATNRSIKHIRRRANDREKIKNTEKALQSLREDLNKEIYIHSASYIKRSTRFDEDVEEIQRELKLTAAMLNDMEISGHPECMEATRTEYIDDMTSWPFSNSEKQIFWLRGIPGCGKSTVAQTIARHPKIRPYLISHIFFNRETARQHDILKIISYRLATSDAGLASRIALRLHRPRLTLADEFRELILEPLNEASLETPMIIIIDALDEYGTADSRTPLVQLIGNEFSKLPRQVRIFITSRPEADIVAALSSNVRIWTRELKCDSEENRQDVSVYIAAEMKKLVPSKASDGPSWEDQIAKVSRNADGLFIWAAVATELVHHSPRPYRKLCALASTESELTLDDMYRKALEAADLNWRDADVRRLFASIFALLLSNQDMITITLLDLLFGFERDSSANLIFKLQSFVSRSSDGSLQVRNRTFADFLLSKSRLPAEPWYINMDDENAFIARRCFLAMNELDFDACTSVTHPRHVAKHSEISPHIRYASLHWAQHLHGATFSLDVVEHLRVFLSERLLFWFEVLRLLSEFSQVASKALRDTEDWVSARDMKTSLFLRDALEIQSRFSAEISKGSTLIYATALPLTRKENTVSAQFMKVMADSIRIENTSATFDGELNRPFLNHTEAILSVSFSPDMDYIVSGSSDHTVRIWNTQTAVAATAPFVGHSDTVRTVAVSPDGRLIASGSDDRTIRLWNVDTGSAIGKPLLGHEGWVSSVAFSPDGVRLVSGSRDKTVRVWDVMTGTALGEPIRGHYGALTSVAWSPDGRRIISGSFDCKIRVWDARNGAAVGEPLQGHDHAVLSVAYSADGRYVASGSNDATIRIWDSQTGASVGRPLEGHEGGINTVTFSPDGWMIASGSDDQTIRLWDLRTCAAVGDPLKGHENVVRSIAFCIDGSRIVSGGEDGRIFVWDVRMSTRLIGMTNEPRAAIASVEREVIEDPDGNLTVNGYQFFAKWKIDKGWLVGAAGEHRLWLPQYMRGLVRQGHMGLYVHLILNLRNCNGAAEEYRGFTFSD